MYAFGSFDPLFLAYFFRLSHLPLPLRCCRANPAFSCLIGLRAVWTVAAAASAVVAVKTDDAKKPNQPFTDRCWSVGLLHLHCSPLPPLSHTSTPLYEGRCNSWALFCTVGIIPLLFARVSGGLRPGGLRPGGLRPWGIEPTWLRPRWIEPTFEIDKEASVEVWDLDFWITMRT